MRIVTAKEFIEMQPPVIFQKYQENNCFEWGNLCLKFDNILPNDFFYVDLMGEWVFTKDFEPKGSGELFDLLDKLEKTTQDFERDYEGGERDSSFDMQQRYVVYDNNDIEQLIKVLRSAIKKD